MGKKVFSLMTSRPVVGNLSSSFSQILTLFTEFPIHHLPIVDADNKLIGMVSSNDLAKVFLKLCNRPLKIAMDITAIDNAISVSDIMTPTPVSISSEDSVAAAIQILSEKKFLALPVVDEGVLVGILSAKDIIADLG